MAEGDDAVQVEAVVDRICDAVRPPALIGRNDGAPADTRREGETMLEMRPDCERYGTDLPAQNTGAFICSFECTFCAECADALNDMPELWRRTDGPSDPREETARRIPPALCGSSRRERAASSRILSIAGSDSSGGAGIQADMKTVTMLGGYAMTAITAVTLRTPAGCRASSRCRRNSCSIG